MNISYFVNFRSSDWKKGNESPAQASGEYLYNSSHIIYSKRRLVRRDEVGGGRDC